MVAVPNGRNSQALLPKTSPNGKHNDDDVNKQNDDDAGTPPHCRAGDQRVRADPARGRLLQQQQQ